MDFDWKLFAWVFVGALAPEIIRLWTLAKDGKGPPGKVFYFVMAVIFSALGGVVAVAMGSANVRSAFYAGISTPVLISTVAKRVNARRRAGKAKKSGPALTQVGLSRFESYFEAL